jgi:hypothetical protein
LLAAVMTVAILVVHLRRDIWAAAGGFEFPLLMLTSPYLYGSETPVARPKLRPSGGTIDYADLGQLSLFRGKATSQPAPDYVSTFRGEGD